MASKVGFAVFGLGRMGQLHCQNIIMSPRARLCWVIRNNVEEARRFVDDYDLSTRAERPDNLEPILNDPKVNAVLIASPTWSHEHIIRQALSAGKSVFCEKPITPDSVTTKQCYDIAANAKMSLFCAFHRHFDPSFRNLRQNVVSGEFGNLRILKASSRDMTIPAIDYIRTSGGIFRDSTIHDLEMSTWIAGSTPLSVYVQGHAHDPDIAKCEDRDHVVVVIKYQNGVISIIDNCRQAPYGYDQRLEALCDRGMLAVGNQQQTSFQKYGKAENISPRHHADFATRYSDAYRNELEHFIDVVQGKSELEVTESDTLLAMKLVEACQKSVETSLPVHL